jgi:hypothetical protein
MSHELEILAGVAGGSSPSCPHPIPLPAYRARDGVRIEIRPATMEDLPFIDRLQKMHTKMVGFMPMKQLEGKVGAGHVLVAEEVGSRQRAVGSVGPEEVGSSEAVPQPTAYSLPPTPLGYCISRDQYFKRDDVGIIYQLNVLPTHQRGLIGAHLLKAVFERAAYGCRLFCCWCAQDIAANRFWEAMGFVPLAYRAGGTARGQKAQRRGQKENARVHIFWQKRIREGDTSTPWWFPCKTDAGAIREDRIVLPIPMGKWWNDEMPLILPCSTGILPVAGKKEHGQDARGTRQTRKSKVKNEVTEKRLPFPRNGVWYSVPRQPDPTAIEKAKQEAKPKLPRVKAKCDPKLVAAARELRDRWLERVNAREDSQVPVAKYALGRSNRDHAPERGRRVLIEASAA